MKKKIIIAIFVVLAGGLAALFIGQKIFYHPEEQKTTSTVVIPQVDSATGSVSNETLTMAEENALVSLVPLNSDETLLSIVSMDFDGDGFDDQVNSIKTSSSPYISLLVGLYNPKKNEYERMAVIPTEISQVRTFSYTGMDLTGNHRIALVYQGFSENGDSLLQAYFISRYNGRFRMYKIADFRGDGTIYVQQMDRYDAYETSHAKGASFPIWVYSSDTSRPNSVDQLQTKYEWNEEEGIYTLTAQIRVAGSRIAQKELARIQDGTVKTFAKFLNGLWYKTVNNSDEKLYLFFDYENSEVIFFNQTAEEIYKWAHSTIRRNGIYLSVINQEIENLQRRMNISLVNVDQIYVRNVDDLRMPIGESNLWDGDYKKVSPNSVYAKSAPGITASEIVSNLEKGPAWKTSEGNLVLFEKGNVSVRGDLGVDSGIYTQLQIGKEPFIQFRSSSNLAWLNQTYLASYATVSSKSKTLNKDCIILQPYLVQPDGTYALEKRTIVLTKYVNEEE